jgi:predicted SprT family Zn-dependent metalloprotease
MKNERQDLAQETLEKQWAFFVAKYPQLKNCYFPTVALSGRLKTKAGYQQGAKIVICDKLMQASPLYTLRTILVHELCHYVDACLNGEPPKKQWHGKRWALLMLQCGLEPCEYSTAQAWEKTKC